MTTFRYTPPFTPHRSIRAATLGVALTAIVGIATPAMTLADDAAFTPITQNQRSIMLSESKEAPGGVLAGGGAPDFAQTANGRSIALVESKEPDQGTASAVDAAGTEAQGWPDFDSTTIAVRQVDSDAVLAAIEEARGWPNFDSTAIVVR